MNRGGRRPPLFASSWPVTKRSGELMGAEINLHLDYKGVRIVARTGSTYPGREGATGSLRFKQDKIHLFDKETEKAIAH